MATRRSREFSENLWKDFVNNLRHFSFLIVDDPVNFVGISQPSENIVRLFRNATTSFDIFKLVSTPQSLFKNFMLKFNDNIYLLIQHFDSDLDWLSKSNAHETVDEFLSVYMYLYDARKIIEDHYANFLKNEKLKEFIINHLEEFGRISKDFTIDYQVQEIPEVTHKAHQRKILIVKRKS